MKNYYQEYKKIPTVEQTAKEFDISKYKVVEYFRLLEHQGFLKRNFSRYQIKNINSLEKKEEKKEKITEKINKIPRTILVIRTAMGIIGAGAVVLSIYYTGMWLCEFLHFILAYLLSTIMVAFSVVAFETLIILRENKQYFLMLVFSFLWLIVLIFSMISTVAGQYNQKIENKNIKISENVKIIHKNQLWDVYNNNEEEIMKQIENKTIQIEDLQKLLSEFDTLEKREEKGWFFWDTTERIRIAEEQLTGLRNELKIVRENKTKYLEEETEVGAIEETVEEQPSFYIWIGSIFNIESRFIQFWLSVFPAVFLDIVAPLSIAVSMFLKRKEKENG